MAKQNIHPKMNKVTFQFSQGRKMVIPSSYPKSSFLMETDIFNHMAWREDTKTIHLGSANVAKFKKFFGDVSFIDTIKKAESGEV